ncbi:MAG: hypothetical protein AB2794_11685 [Candidatus Thiodiazotropha endolucinida]
MELIGIIIGIFACYIIWPILKWWLNQVTTSSELPPPDGIEEKDWLKLISPSRLKSGSEDTEINSWLQEIKRLPNSAPEWLGILERILSFTAFFLNAPLIIVGWLAFKVASKWQVWANVVQVPKASDGAIDKSSITFLIARHRWGSFILMRFLIGTVTNVLLGIVLAYFIKYALC